MSLPNQEVTIGVAAAVSIAAMAGAYLILAYVLLPVLWTHHEHEPGLASLPEFTRRRSLDHG